MCISGIVHPNISTFIYNSERKCSHINFFRIASILNFQLNVTSYLYFFLSQFKFIIFVFFTLSSILSNNNNNYYYFDWKFCGQKILSKSNKSLVRNTISIFFYFLVQNINIKFSLYKFFVNFYKKYFFKYTFSILFLMS